MWASARARLRSAQSSASAPIVEVGLTEPPVTKDEPSQPSIGSSKTTVCSA